MREQIIPKEKRFVTIAEYQKLTNLGYKAVKDAIKTGQLKHIKTEGGRYKIDTYADSGADVSLLINKIDDLQKSVAALCRQFNTSI